MEVLGPQRLGCLPLDLIADFFDLISMPFYDQMDVLRENRASVENEARADDGIANATRNCPTLYTGE